MLTTYLPEDMLQQIISFVSLHELVSLAKSTPHILQLKYGTLEFIMQKSFKEFLIKKPKHSFPSETLQRCKFIVINKFEFTNKQMLSIKESSILHSYLKQTILLWGF